MRTGRITVIAAVAAMLLAACTGLSACSGPPKDRVSADRVVMSTGSPRGVYYAWGSALADQLSDADVPVTVGSSSGSLENLARLRSGDATLVLATEDATVGVDGVLALARVYDDYVHVLVRRDGPVAALPDLAGRRVAVGSSGSGTALVAGRLLAEAGLRVQAVPLDVVAGAAALRAGTVDAVVWSGGVPTAAVADLARVLPVRLLPLDGVATALRDRYDGVYRPATVPVGSYGGTEPVSGIASANLLLVRADLSSPTVSVILRTMFERRAQLAAKVPAARAFDVRTAIFTGDVPLHPAAVTYYRGVKP